MRNFTLLLAFLAFTGMTFAQSADCGLTVGGKVEKSVATQQPKAFGDVIWSEDFNGDKWAGTVVEDGAGFLLDVEATLPEGWSIVDNNELNYFWHWSNVGPRGRYTSPGVTSANAATASFVPRADVVDALASIASVDNGFMLLESDYFNTNPATGLISSDPIDMDAILEFGPIDMTNAPGAIFSLKTMYRTCCSWDRLLGLAVGIPDGAGGITWSDEIALNILTPNNTYTYTSERDVHVNISRVTAGSSAIVTAGQPEVYFRLHKTAASHYFWLVDDITIYEPPTNDLIVEDTWFDYMYNALDPDYAQSSDASFNFWGGYTQIPQSVVAGFVQFRAAVNNNGTADAVDAKVNVLIEKDGAEVYNVSSTPKTVAKFLRDTLIAAASYTPADLGFYQVSMTVNMNADDEAYSNNAEGYDFSVVEDLYSRVTPGAEDDYASAGPRDWANGGFDGDVCAQPYDFPTSVAQVALKAIKVYFQIPYSDAEIAAIEAGEFAMYGRIYKIDEAGDIVDAGIASDLYTVQISDSGTWVTLDLLDEGNLVVPGGQTYYAGIETYTGSADQSLRFEIGADPDAAKQPSQGGLIYMTSQGNWYLTGDNYAIDLVLNTNPVDPNITLTFNVDMTQPITGGYFTVGTDVVYVTGSYNGWDVPGTGESMILTDTDGDKIYTGSVEIAKNFGELKYKYFKNASWDFGDNVTGDRTITIADVDYVVDPADIWIYVNGIADMDLNAVTIAPNPFNGTLVINNAEKAVQIVVSNVLGQKVMTVSEISNHQVVSTESLSKGVYFVTIVDQNNNTRTERVVKQ
ncbi:MAG TPA: hypothetical protein DCQ26_18990 [Marinilabiliales bacterium]|nr:MAG: hypothetical protein A2W84_11010 [Bacteroidetes bacterium GWC2_40_13]OFX90617.1 MAG: hypothetical protein A2W97_02485 [Bacteroidetes bacterium GWE2_40_63]OFY20905.1 MAG: hypothetical protein A2W88_17775 [Bacteroidetes bacterium GWF2_40_13]OFZ23675.1 MAG: hypothetical protein A2437_06460 [Bacteroidetes bacterium RIFOXYC2_FULL_40_12]HAN00686.1 hypothetical protein [Marinilabiliales bacterium]